MSNSKVLKGQELCMLVQEVVDDVCGAVASTIGPSGTTVGLPTGFGQTNVSKDGYKVMNSFKYDSSSPGKKAVLDLLSKTISEANTAVGDGSSTTAVLCRELAKSVMMAKATQADMNEVNKGILLARDIVLKRLESMKTTIVSKDGNLDKTLLEHIATISANGDEEVGKHIAEQIAKRGEHGIITVEESKGSTRLSVEETEGMNFDRGYLSSCFITNFEKLIVEHENPYVFITDKKISNVHLILPILEAIYNQPSGGATPLLIVAEDVEGDALNTLVLNKIRSSLPIVAVKAPGFGDRRKEILQDIAIATGASYVFSDELNLKPNEVKLEDLGRAKRIIVTRDSTTIIGGYSKDGEVEKRSSAIKSQIASSTSDYDKEKLSERLAKLSGGVSILKVGGLNEVAAKELKDRVEDALNAAKAAVEEGVVPGGGAGLLYATNQLKLLKGETSGQQLGIDIVKRSILAPITKIVDNSCIAESPCVIKYLLDQNDDKLIFNLATGHYANSMTSGVIDPAKVVRIAFTQAVSLALMLMTLNSIIVDIPNKEDSSTAAPAAGMGGMGGMGGF